MRKKIDVKVTNTVSFKKMKDNTFSRQKWPEIGHITQIKFLGVKENDPVLLDA